mmetsp:Transcript_29612/g.82674  ORF Transcript_29612/g.82674 Transcript_29612/m.82674 type:complete len:207 (+) Transcript_29612:52-672(+)
MRSTCAGAADPRATRGRSLVCGAPPQRRAAYLPKRAPPPCASVRACRRAARISAATSPSTRGEGDRRRDLDGSGGCNFVGAGGSETSRMACCKPTRSPRACVHPCKAPRILRCWPTAWSFSRFCLRSYFSGSARPLTKVHLFPAAAPSSYSRSRRRKSRRCFAHSSRSPPAPGDDGAELSLRSPGDASRHLGFRARLGCCSAARLA